VKLGIPIVLNSHNVAQVMKKTIMELTNINSQSSSPNPVCLDQTAPPANKFCADAQIESGFGESLGTREPTLDSHPQTKTMFGRSWSSEEELDIGVDDYAGIGIHPAPPLGESGSSGELSTSGDNAGMEALKTHSLEVGGDSKSNNRDDSTLAYLEQYLRHLQGTSEVTVVPSAVDTRQQVLQTSSEPNESSSSSQSTKHREKLRQFFGDSYKNLMELVATDPEPTPAREEHQKRISKLTKFFGEKPGLVLRARCCLTLR
jgi:hypothetical protein